MVNKVTARRAQLFPWLNRIFPPSSPKVTLPGEIDETMKLFMPALPPSLLLERTAIQSFLSVNPATLVQTPVVPSGRFWWVHAADLFVNAGGALGGTNAQFAFIFISSGVPGDDVMMAMSLLQPQDLVTRVTTHAILTTVYQGGIPTLPNFTAGGGGTGGFLIPQGMRLSGAVTGPIGTAVLRMPVMFTECDIGELTPSVS